MYELRSPTNNKSFRIGMSLFEKLNRGAEANTDNLAELIKKFQSGNIGVYNDILYHVKYYLVAYLLRYKKLFQEDELAQLGRIALFEALRDYDSTAGSKFTTWLYWKVRGQISAERRRSFNNKPRVIKPIWYDPQREIDFKIDMDDVLAKFTKKQLNLLLLTTSLKDIGEQEGVTKQAIGLRRKRLKNKIKVLLKRAGYLDKTGS